MDTVEATVEREVRTPAQPRLQLLRISIGLIHSGAGLSKVLRLRQHSRYTARHARVAESADAQDLKSWVSNGVRVQFPPRAPININGLTHTLDNDSARNSKALCILPLAFDYRLIL